MLSFPQCLNPIINDSLGDSRPPEDESEAGDEAVVLSVGIIPLGRWRDEIGRTYIATCCEILLTWRPQSAACELAVTGRRSKG
jgi:hypothetical protein